MKSDSQHARFFLIWIGIIFQSVYLRSVNGKDETTCSVNYKWDQTNKQCIPCLNGYFGINCETECLFPYYGLRCTSECSCNITECHHVSGCRHQTDQTNQSDNVSIGNPGLCTAGFKWDFKERNCIPCDKGYFGIQCKSKCPSSNYGSGCVFKCDCSERECHHVYGCNGSLTESFLQMIDNNTEKARTMDDTVMHGDFPKEEAGINQIDLKKESTLKIEQVAIGNIVLAIVSGVIILLIICTYPLEKYYKARYQLDGVF